MRVAIAATLLALLLPATALAQDPPGFPATFFGSASIDGQPAPDGTEVRAFVNGVDCTSDSTRGTTFNDGVATYVAQVLSASDREGCGEQGSLVTFTLNGQPAEQTGEWQRFPQQLDLNAGAGEPIPLPSLTPSPVPTAGPSPTPATPAATGTGVSSSATVSPNPSSSSGGGNTSRIAGIILVVSGLAIALGAGAIALSRRKPG